MRSFFIALSLAAGGCSFTVGGVADVDGSAPPDLTLPADLAGLDFAGDDLSVVMPPDLSVKPPDLFMPPPLDFSMKPADLSSSPDLGPPFVPTHVAAGDLVLGSTDVTAMTSINTTKGSLTIDGAGAPPGTTFFVENNSLAVLAVRNFTVPSGSTVAVTGALPLVIVASGTITIAGTLDAGAHGATPGPGGAASGMGANKGSPGVHNGAGGSLADSGGSGAGYGFAGGSSGSDSGCMVNPPGTNGTANGVAGAAAASDLTLATLAGGSGGGAGAAGRCGGAFPVGAGGAGGGAVQLTAAMSITISGAINVGGGGGGGGCKDPAHQDSGSGGGGGSGGAVFLESLAITISGTVAANGGAGGGGAYSTAGGAGGDGTANATPATFGAGGVNGAAEDTTDRGAVGGTNMDALSSANDTACGNTGGGGGGSGLIHLRSRGAATTGGATFSPPQTAATNL